MATKAYILIETSVGKSRDVANELRSLRGVQAADIVTGPYDVIAVVEAADLTAVGALLASPIHTLNGIIRTVTCCLWEDPDPSSRGEESMAITLNHTIVPAHDKEASAEWFARIFGLTYQGLAGISRPWT